MAAVFYSRLISSMRPSLPSNVFCGLLNGVAKSCGTKFRAFGVSLQLDREKPESLRLLCPEIRFRAGDVFIISSRIGFEANRGLGKIGMSVSEAD
jgi:hypothetical protein